MRRTHKRCELVLINSKRNFVINYIFDFESDFELQLFILSTEWTLYYVIIRV